MAIQVFGSDPGKPIVVKANKATVTINKTTILALNVSLTFQRAVEVLPVLGTRKVISIGQPQGQFTAQTMIAKDNNFAHAFGLDGKNDCEGFDMDISFAQDECKFTQGKTVKAKGCIASAVSIEAQGGRGYVAEGATVTFTALELT